MSSENENPTPIRQQIAAALVGEEQQWFDTQLKLFAESKGISTTQTHWRTVAILAAAQEHLKTLSKRRRGRPNKPLPTADDYEFESFMDRCREYLQKRGSMLPNYKFRSFVSEVMRVQGMGVHEAEAIRKREHAIRKRKRALKELFRKSGK